MNNSIKMLSPFVLYCQKVIPLAFDESMSYYECLCALYSYLKDTVVPAVNNNAEALEEVQKAMIELKDYVDHYFDNLDIQTEIDNKLDEMADSGELASIIAQYLDAQFIYGFDTIANLKGAETLAEGNICRILGKTSYATGDGAFYRVRSLTVYDVIDDDEIVGLTNYPSLVAEKITDYAINHVESEITALDTRLDALEKPKKYLIVGDSYATGWSPDSTVSGWPELMVSLLGLQNSQYVIHAKGGVAMAAAIENNFYNYISEFDSDNDITDIVVAGGYNDLADSATQASIRQGLLNVKNLCATKYPNAKLHIGFIGNTTNYTNKGKLIRKCMYYVLACNEFNVDYIQNSELTLHNYASVFSSDGIHPNLAGETAIAEVFAEYLQNGSSTFILPVIDMNAGLPGLRNKVYNEVTTFEYNGSGLWTPGTTAGNYVCNGTTAIKIADLTQGYILGSTDYPLRFPIETVLVTGLGQYYNVNGMLAIEGNVLNYYPLKINSSNNNYDTIYVSAVQIPPFHFTISSLEC